MATNEANMQKYFQHKRVFDALEMENMLKHREIMKLEHDIDMLDRNRHCYEDAIEECYAQTKIDARSLPQEMIFDNRYFEDLNRILRGSESVMAEEVLIKGKHKAFREIMRLEAEIEDNDIRMAREEEAMRDARDSED